MTTPPNFDRGNRRFGEQPGHAEVADDSITMTAHDRYVRYVHARELAVLRDIVRRGTTRILDAGCGTGRLAIALAPHTREVVGLDLSESLLERARSSATAARLRNLRFLRDTIAGESQLGQFDLVVLSGVLNCLADGDAAVALEHAVARLQPAGRLYLRNACATRARFVRNGNADNAPAIYRTADEYIAMVTGTGQLRIVREGYLFPPLCLPNLVYRHLLPPALRDRRAIGAVLDAWFRLELATADARLHYLEPLYAPIMRALHKDTAFHVIVAESI